VRNLIVLGSALLLSVASAVAFPLEGSVLVTDAGGTIVGVGQVAGGATFELDLLAGFDGAVRLIFVSDGRVVVHDASVEAGVVSIDGVDLAVLLAEAGFVTVRVAPAAAIAGGDRPEPRAASGRDPDREQGQERTGERPAERAHEGTEDGAAGGDAGAGRREDAPGQADDPPGQADDPPGQADDPPGQAERPVPPPERPIEPPAARGAP
jgi:ribosomal protein L12E/L44/L45/RPP1/RPP2